MKKNFLNINIRQYGGERFKYVDYNSGKHHVYVIFDYYKGKPIWGDFYMH